MSIVAEHIKRNLGDPPTQVLHDISLTVDAGEFIALTGRSGSGKSTLLYILSTLDTASSGRLFIAGEDVKSLKSRDLHYLRNQQIGFVFQFHYLIAELTALENVLLPAMKAHSQQQKIGYAKHLLSQFGLAQKMHRLPRQLSGGEQQRVAIARALVMQPRYLFADEPTGALDSANGEIVMNIIGEFNKNSGMTVVIVTHDTDYANLADRTIQLRDGAIVGDKKTC